MRKYVYLFLLITFFSAPVAADPINRDNYIAAQQNFESLSLHRRIILQVLLTAAGYWNAVPNEDFSHRLYKQVEKFQTDNGYPSNGILDAEELDKLNSVAWPLLKRWGFLPVAEPYSGKKIWVPVGLGLTSAADENGIRYAGDQARLRIAINTNINTRCEDAYAGTLNALNAGNANIHYKILKQGWYVISFETADGLDHYARYHQNGADLTGFTASWDNNDHSLNLDRAIDLMSASLYSTMTGAPFIDPINEDDSDATASTNTAPAVTNQNGIIASPNAASSDANVINPLDNPQQSQQNSAATDQALQTSSQSLEHQASQQPSEDQQRDASQGPTENTSKHTDDVVNILPLLFLCLIVFLYFLPTVIANQRHHNSAAAIAVINTFLGWTFLGWVIALAWAFTGDVRQDQRGRAV